VIAKITPRFLVREPVANEKRRYVAAHESQHAGSQQAVVVAETGRGVLGRAGERSGEMVSLVTDDRNFDAGDFDAHQAVMGVQVEHHCDI
jgi:hypothetical protein